MFKLYDIPFGTIAPYFILNRNNTKIEITQDIESHLLYYVKQNFGGFSTLFSRGNNSTKSFVPLGSNAYLPVDYIQLVIAQFFIECL